ncbi:adenosylmethionine--8-amino-7-oxononanoate transaminase [Bordetella petrii]|uniref:adenosylmethionine--8-amino-7-oxononanoate transaminase n=1 Tax=Bordetella petrii TaxID=94624 RepID=UPI001E3427CA|nr:adenosylmethionine--8-amino-7-oxononanoate transaminase [Bordetella petrii]MCD0506178.1 adenosylmethionine--8-amino-7-oxononanoate transaminase [Bordetella petrii]
MRDPTHLTQAADWRARSLRHVWHPCTQMKRQATLPLLALSHGTGPWLVDMDGRRYLDAISSWWVNLFGHADARINAAVADQLTRLPHAMLAGCTHAPAVQLAERLSALTGAALGHCFYASDGASAVEIALKMSFHAWRNLGHKHKREFVSVRHGYHGETLGALGVTDVALFRDAYGPLLRHAHVVDSPDARNAQAGEDAEAVARRAAAGLQALLEDRHAHIAAVIVEPLVQCAAGMAMHHPAYLRQVRELCDQYQVHLIADEIAVGCGRTGSFFACEQAGIWPDLMTLSKGISGGTLPLSLVLSSDAIHDAFYDDSVARGFLHSHSYTGNPLACRAALATLDIFDADDVLARNAGRAAVLDAALAPLHSHRAVRHMRRAGMIWAFDVQADAGFGQRYASAALTRGLLLRPIGNTVYLMPPYILDDGTAAWLAHETLATLDDALEAP